MRLWLAIAEKCGSRDYDGVGTAAGQVFVMTPNNSNTWSMSILAATGTPPSETVSAGINGRFRYVPALRGSVVHPRASSNMFFLRTAWAAQS